MSFIQMTKDRYSVRKFDGRPVEPEKLTEILEAGRRAPTAVNYQPQRVLVIDTDEGREKVSKCMPYLFNAPVVLVICYDKTVSAKNHGGQGELGEVDATIATTQMMYAAQELGLGTLWIGGYKLEDLRREFDIPDFLVPVALLDVGYPAEDSRPHPTLHESRYPLEETVYHGTFTGIEPGKPGRK